MTSNNNNNNNNNDSDNTQPQQTLKPILKGTKSNFTLVHNISNVTDERVKDYLKTEILVKEWIEEVLKIKIKENLFDALKNGIVLCYLANEIQNNIVPMITEKSKLGLEFKNNIDFFLLALKDFGFPKQKLFNLNDLYEGENIVRVVECLSSLSKFACTQKGFNIPMKSAPSSNNTIKLPTSNEQLKKLKLQLSQIKDYTDKSNGNGQTRIGTNVLKARMALLAGNTIDFVKCERGFIKFQSLWRGFKDRQMVKKMKRDIAYREKVSQEILKTEEDYVKSLNCCIKGYMEPLVSKELINKDQQKLIFSDIQIIYNFGNKFLEELRKRCGVNWTVYQKLSDMFISISSFLKVYTSYVQNYNTALETLEELKKKDKFLNALNEIKEQSTLVNGHDITAFLIQPVQRVPRYYLLLTDLVKHSTFHPDYEKLVGAAEKIKDVAKFLNERKREGENFQKFTEIQSILVGKVPQLFTPSRRYIKQIGFTTSQKSKKETIVYLFNDVIIYGKVIKGIFSSSSSSSDTNNHHHHHHHGSNSNTNSSNDKVKYQGMIELISSVVYDHSDNITTTTTTTTATTTTVTTHSFELRTSDRDNLTLLTIYAKNQNEKNDLKNEIKKLIGQIHENLRSKEQKLIESSALGNGSNGDEEDNQEPTIEEQLQRNKTMKKVESINTTTSTTNTTSTTTTSTTPPLTTPRESSPSRNNSNNGFSPPNSPEHQQSVPVSSFISSLFSKKKHHHQSNTITSPPISSDSDSNSNSSTTVTSPPLSPISPSTQIDEAETNIKSSPKQSRKSKRQTLSSSSSSQQSSTVSTTTSTTTTTPSSSPSSPNTTVTSPQPSSPSTDETTSSANSKINRPRSTSRFSKIAGVLTLRKRREKSQIVDESQIPTSDDESGTPTKSPPNETLDQSESTNQPTLSLSASTPNPSNNNNNNIPNNLTSSTNTTPTSTNSSTINRLSSSSSVSTNSECDTTNSTATTTSSTNTPSDNNSTTPTNHLSYEKILLLKNELDLMKLETYLSDEEFKKVFNVERSEFLNYPKWKQTQKKKDLKLL